MRQEKGKIHDCASLAVDVKYAEGQPAVK